VSERLARTTEKNIMKTITKFIFGFASLALACGSIAFAQVQFEPVTPADSAAKAAVQAAVQGAAPVEAVKQTVIFNSGSRWHLTVNAMDQFGLVITGASFQKTPTSPFIYVLFDGRMGEIFVPYHSGSPRFPDIKIGFPCLTLKPADFPAPRKIIGGGKICKEVRDYLAWMNGVGHNPPLVRYGQEVIYFSVIGAGNYQYIIEWTFRDDGAILVRAGSTGPKIECASAPCAPGQETAGHMHNFTWRLDIDLNGANGNSAYWTKHKEDLTAPPCLYNRTGCSTATDRKELISVEGSKVWDPENFNTLMIQDRTLKNANGRPTTYELVPMRSGTARHTEAFTKKDFWVSRFDPAQSFLADDLPVYVQNRQPTVNTDLVIWYTGSEHHETNSRDEDRDTVPVLWTGFELVPNNLFDGTPFYP